MVQNKYSTVQWFCIVKNYFNFISHNAHCCNWELSRYIKFQLEFLESIGPFHLPSLKKSFEMVRFKCNMVFRRLDKYVVFPKHQQILDQVGENIRLARKRRKLTTIQVADRAGIDRTTLYNIEKGSGSVSMAAYFNTLRVLGLQNDFLKLAADDEFGRKLQDLDLIGGK